MNEGTRFTEDMFEIEYSEKGIDILKIAPEYITEYNKDSRYLSLFDNGHIQGKVFMPIGKRTLQRLLDSRFSDKEIYRALRACESGRERLYPSEKKTIDESIAKNL